MGNGNWELDLKINLKKFCSSDILNINVVFIEFVYSSDTFKNWHNENNVLYVLNNTHLYSLKPITGTDLYVSSLTFSLLITIEWAVGLMDAWEILRTCTNWDW